MTKKTIELDEDILQFALERCAADINLGLQTAKRAAVGRGSISDGKRIMDYVVMVRRLKVALEKAR